MVGGGKSAAQLEERLTFYSGTMVLIIIRV
jgi:hypothetical protein